MFSAASIVRAASLAFWFAVMSTASLYAQALPQPAVPAAESAAPIMIMAVGNRLIVTSEDPEALALVNELVRTLTKTKSTEGDFTVIQLKNARAVDAARILDECYNGVRDTGVDDDGLASPHGGRWPAGAGLAFSRRRPAGRDAARGSGTRLQLADGAAAPRGARHWRGRTVSFSCFAIRAFTTVFAGILIASPVAGLRPIRALRF